MKKYTTKEKLTRKKMIITLSFMNKKKLPEVEPVKLKPHFGMRPGLYILLSTIAIFLFLFFLLFMLPGIIKGGEYLRFSSALSNTGVVLDGKYLGSSEGSLYFVPSGEHELSYYKEGVHLYSQSIDVSHPVFFTLFHKRVKEIEIAPQSTEELKKTVIDTFCSDISEEAKITGYSDVFRMRPLISDFAYDAISLSLTEEEINSALYFAYSQIASEELMNDLYLAVSYLEENGISIAFSIDPLIYEKNVEISISSIKPYLDDGDFLYFEEGEIIIGENTVSYPSFRISKKPVTVKEYSLFVEENPEWSISNRTALIEKGLVDEYYLEGITVNSRINNTSGIRNISYYAANAYIDYINEKNGSDYSLPSEIIYMVAASNSDEYALSLNYRNERDKLSSALGGLWEMTDTAYLKNMRSLDYSLISSFDNPNLDIIIKGGSWINDPSEITIDTVGTSGKDMCSEYMGFRVCEIL